ncbi:MAG: hypothetical protein VX498_05855, partial [Myxococcota bacterium]|nr:hypothetical protein [Myxococcota bacterium]
LAACSAPTGPAVELGTGEIEFVAIEDDDTLEIFQGPQGGFHLLASIRTKGIEPGDRGNLEDSNNPTITLDVVHEDESFILIGPITQGLDPAPIGELPFTHQMTGRFAILDIEDDDVLSEESVTFSVRVQDSDGVEVEDSVDVHLAPHPNNQ